MASNNKRKTTMSKLNRENRLRERRLNKQAKKEARKLAPAESHAGLDGDPEQADLVMPSLAGALETPADA
jgi:hypothetical protein